jgi:hypothetical protein
VLPYESQFATHPKVASYPTVWSRIKPIPFNSKFHDSPNKPCSEASVEAVNYGTPTKPIFVANPDISGRLYRIRQAFIWRCIQVAKHIKDSEDVFKDFKMIKEISRQYEWQNGLLYIQAEEEESWIRE